MFATRRISLLRAAIALLFALILFAGIAQAPATAQAADPAANAAKSKLGDDTILSNDGLVIENLPAVYANAARTQTYEAGSLLTATANPLLSPSTVHGVDNRSQVTTTDVYPYRAIVHISSSIGGCTGWLNGPRTVITAGHCVFGANGWATNVVVTPGKNGQSAPYGTSGAHRLFSVKGWTSSSNTNYDYGAIQLDVPFGNTVGYFGYRWTSANLKNTVVSITGYPGDKPFGTMWTASGKLINGTYKLTYDIDTAPGQSGAPVYQASFPACGVCSVAIHTNGGSSLNSGTRIRQAVFNNLKMWKNYVYP